MKVVTMYLPQFHRVSENDEWWGEGFTEWTAVRQAVPLFENHYQPRVPLSNDYYNLLDKETMRRQCQLMNEYHVYGQCFYHYWFKNGRKILEKPAENLLKWTDINIPFCFSWDSGAWVRTWSGIQDANTWVRKFDKPKQNEDDNGLLLEQDYGGKVEWREHFYYLLPFFKDERYIKIDNKPVFIFYRPDEIYCLDEMTGYWQDLAKQVGMPGLYMIGTNCTEHVCLDAVYWQEPRRAFDRLSPISVNTVRCFDMDRTWNWILSERPGIKNKVYFGGMVGYDDTPRKGTLGQVLVNNTPQKFEQYFARLIKKNEVAGNELVFLNAWNEWSEGAYLEPDGKYGNEYLQSLRNALCNYENSETVTVFEEQDAEHLLLSNRRYKSYMQILSYWMGFKERGIKLQDYFISRGWNEIAIYGIGMLGIHLIRELEKSSVKISYGIDMHADAVKQAFPVIYPTEELKHADVIVVTPILEYNEIYCSLCKKTSTPIISLQQIFLS